MTLRCRIIKKATNLLYQTMLNMYVLSVMNRLATSSFCVCVCKTVALTLYLIVLKRTVIVKKEKTLKKM